MTGLIFAVSMFVILVAVGALFAWMVRLASISKQSAKPAETKPLRV